MDRLAVPVAYLQKDAVWSIDASYAAYQSVAALTDYGTLRANGTWLLELAPNMKSPTVYDNLGDGERVMNQV